MEDPERDEQVRQLAASALQRDASERAAFLDTIQSQDPALRMQVESLMATFGATAASSDGFSGDPAAAPRTIGAYRLVEKLGQGGMGQVWLAEQTSPVRRRVAVKLIRPGFHDSSLLERFRSERQSLAIMDHPAIAKVFDAGVTADGQPYFVMEYVEGVPITDYCDRENLDLRSRLALLIRVCEGVQHAHQKAILHRDLKPANILVIDVDGRPTPRIIDFGLAKAMTSAATEGGGLTQFGVVVGTPGFMSPEQALPGGVDVDTRTDVYALGVVLYVLLTGFLPVDDRELLKKPLDQILRHVREVDPPRPSTKVRLEKEPSEITAKRRGTDREHLARSLSGDLDWITMKAMDKDRDRRYGTPSELAADIARHLNHEPVLARPATAGYRLRKYVRRHRVGAAAAAGLVLLLAGFAFTQAIQVRRITRERDRADRVSSFMTAMFKVSDPSEARGSSIPAREILDKAAKSIDTGLAGDPQLQAALADTMGEVYRNLGLYAPSEELLSRGLELKRKEYGPRDRKTVATSVQLASTLADAGRAGEAEPLLRFALEAQREALGTDSRETLGTMNTLATVLDDQGHYDEGEKLYREIIVLQRRVLGPEHADTLTSMSNLALDLQDLGGRERFEEGEKLDRDVLEIRRRTLGPDHPDTLRSMANLAVFLGAEGGHDDEAESLLRSVLDMQRRVLGPEHPDTLTSLGALAVALYRAGKLSESEELHRRLLESQRRVLGPEHPGTLSTMHNLAAVLITGKKLAEAEQLERATLEIRRRLLGPDHPRTLRSMASLAEIVQDQGRVGEAEQMLREQLRLQRKVLGPDNPDNPIVMYNLGTVVAMQGNLVEAEELLRETVELANRLLSPTDPTLGTFHYGLARVLARRGRGDDAIQSLQSAIDHGLDPGIMAALDEDPDLASLRGDLRFKTLLATARDRAAPPAPKSP